MQGSFVPIKVHGCKRCGGALGRGLDETYCLMCGHRPESLKAMTSLPKLSETEFQAQVVRAARMFRWMISHMTLPQRSEPGVPDLLMVRPPRVIFAELKRQNGRVTIPQHMWFHDLDECPGVEVYIWKPSDWDEIVEVMR